MNKLIKIIDKFERKKIGIIGDLMLDRFVWGDTERISPEAPVPVVSVKKETFMPGGAGNVANNISSLKGNSSIIGIVGNDKSASRLLNLLRVKKINVLGVLKSSDRPTIQKTRIIARSQQVVRVDKENCNLINTKTENKIISFIKSHIKEWDSLIVSDYNKGLVTERLAKTLVELSIKHKKPIVVDAKPKQANYFKNVTVITPNYKEAIKIAEIPEDKKDDSNKLKEAGKRIQEKLNSDVIITQGAQGMALFEKNKIRYFPTKAKGVFDVSGAGDTVTATVALSLASGASLEEAAIIANHAAGIVVGKLGTSTLSLEELKKSLENEEK